MVRMFAYGAMGHWIDPSWDGPTKLFLIATYITMCFHNVEQDVALW